MGISDSVIAASIGALATITTALFQLVTALRARAKVEAGRPPKRSTTARSLVAVMALMIASAVGGFLFAEYRRQDEVEGLRVMRDELKELKELTARMAAAPREAAAFAIDAAPPTPEYDFAPVSTAEPLHGVFEDGAESVVYVPACRSTSQPCTEADAQRVALCGSIPSIARVEGIELFVQPDAVQDPWDDHRATLEVDLGGARFTGRSFEYAQGEDEKAVCVNFMHWSSEHPHIARIVVRYAVGEPVAPPEPLHLTPLDLPAPTVEPVSEIVPAVIAADTLR